MRVCHNVSYTAHIERHTVKILDVVIADDEVVRRSHAPITTVSSCDYEVAIPGIVDAVHFYIIFDQRLRKGRGRTSNCLYEINVITPTRLGAIYIMTVIPSNYKIRATRVDAVIALTADIIVFDSVPVSVNR